MDIYELVYIVAVATAIAFVVWPRRPKQQHGKITLPNGHAYQYTMGDYLRSYASRGEFHGIDTALPKALPHIYLDSMRGGRRRARFVPEPSQYVSLEGDFNEYYRLFVPKKYGVLALSILSPDVMATLQDHAMEFDVEIYQDHVRIISNKRPSGSKQLQEALLGAAQKITQEIDHRLSSWSDRDSLAALTQDLRLYPGGGIRVFGRYITYWTMAWTGYWLFSGLGILLVAVALIADIAWSRPFAYALLTVFAVLFVLLFIESRRRWGTGSNLR